MIQKMNFEEQLANNLAKIFTREQKISFAWENWNWKIVLHLLKLSN